MTILVTENCRLCRFTECVAVCPVACFHADDDMVYIDNDVCIDCRACIPVCPVKAILAEEDLAESQIHWIEVNAEKSKSLPVVEDKQHAAADGRKPPRRARLLAAGYSRRRSLDDIRRRNPTAPGGDRGQRSERVLCRRGVAAPAHRRAGRHVRSAADAVRLGSRRGRAGPPEDQTSHPGLRQDRAVAWFHFSRQCRDRPHRDDRATARRLSCRRPGQRRERRPAPRHCRRGPCGQSHRHRVRRLVQRAPRLPRSQSSIFPATAPWSSARATSPETSPAFSPRRSTTCAEPTSPSTRSTRWPAAESAISTSSAGGGRHRSSSRRSSSRSSDESAIAPPSWPATISRSAWPAPPKSRMDAGTTPGRTCRCYGLLPRRQRSTASDAYGFAFSKLRCESTDRAESIR